MGVDCVSDRIPERTGIKYGDLPNLQHRLIVKSIAL